AAALGHLEVEGAGQMQRLDVAHPCVGQLVVGPAPGHQNGDLVVAGALERPVVAGRQPLDHVEGIDSRFVRVSDLRHDVSALPIELEETHATARYRSSRYEPGTGY